MRMVKAFCVSFLIVGLGLITAGCTTQPSLREQLAALPVKHLDLYEFNPATPLIDRLTDAPAELLDLYASIEKTPPLPCRLSEAEREQIRRVLDRLPLRHREVLQQRLIGVYCVDNFAGSGMADYILGPGEQLYAVLVLHRRVFTMKAAELLSFRENTAFGQADPQVGIRVELSEEVSALAYIVLHETSHIVDYVQRHTPYVEPALFELFGRSPRDTPFTDQAWSDYSVLRPSIDFGYKEKLRFYGLGGEPALTNREAVPVYEALSRTPFASLYACLNWAEDFAEFVTFYYLVQAWGAHYAIRVEHQGDTLFTYEPMRSPLVTERARLLDPELFQPEGR
jgi:hypothetical protein